MKDDDVLAVDSLSAKIWTSAVSIILSWNS